MKFLVLVPAYNVDKKVGKTIKTVLSVIQDPQKVVVIDDGSNDKTAKIVNAYNVVLLQHDKNRGKGAALKTGFNYALKQDVAWAIIMDADGQHDPKYIPMFFEMAQKKSYDLILGRRNINKNQMPGDRYFSNQFSSLVLSLITGIRIWDSQCGYRLIKLNRLKKMTLRTNHFETESELLLQYIRSGAQIGQMPVSTIYCDENSSMNRFVDSLRFVKMLGTSIFQI